jgi:uncharacterized OsmC-like protein
MPRYSLYALVLILMIGTLTACQPVQPVEAQQPATTLATAKAFAQNSNMPGHVLVTARGNHFLIGSAPPLGHEALEINPVESMLSALATCGIFIHEAVAMEQDIPLNAVSALVQADWDVRGLRGEPVDPHMQAIRVHLTIDGPNAEQIAFMRDEYMSRCPIYTTLIRAAPIEITTNDEAMNGPIAADLAMASVNGVLTNQPGRAIINVRNHYMVSDSVTPLGFPSEETNPMDMFLGALASCATLIAENQALADGVPLVDAGVSVEADFDPRGLRGEDVNPRIQAMRVHWKLSGVDEGQAEALVDSWINRCPIYNTYIRATDITVTSEVVEGAISVP